MSLIYERHDDEIRWDEMSKGELKEMQADMACVRNISSTEPSQTRPEQRALNFQLNKWKCIRFKWKSLRANKMLFKYKWFYFMFMQRNEGDDEDDDDDAD